jgi:manganese/zinc/iron transport system substrate-binding protein
MDPQAWAKAVDVVAEKLQAIDPNGSALYEKNRKRYQEKIEELDRYAEKVLHSIPQNSRVLLTAHDAFNYFGRRYGLEVVGIQGISTESEAGVQDIERLVSLLVKRKIGAVFVESTVSQRNIRALIEGAAAKGHTVRIGGELFSDAMGKAGTYEGTYVGMVDHNVTTIARALGGEAPQEGFQGKLSHSEE